MPSKLNLKIIEKAGKIIILSYIILALSFLAIVLFFHMSGKNVSVGFNYPFPGMFLGLLVNIGILMLILVSAVEFIRAYRKAVNSDQ